MHLQIVCVYLQMSKTFEMKNALMVVRGGMSVSFAAKLHAVDENDLREYLCTAVRLHVIFSSVVRLFVVLMHFFLRSVSGPGTIRGQESARAVVRSREWDARVVRSSDF